ncbi:hypothetical protein [Oceanobacillus saliphilus]|uniref:hypothetical protein n=1 Tax=Oceanobacillus saliphilus TaxID=2925834 RepID=UPI0027D2B8E0|nr:hypothetical protein [Oceanobacillus saliphilus]
MMMPFLYFPEDKAEYIPAIIALAVFIFMAVLAMNFMIKKSRRDEKDFKEKYDKLLKKASNDKTNS